MGIRAAFLERLDGISEATVGKLHRPKGIVVSILVHSVFLDTEEADTTRVDPQQAITIADLEACIKEFLQIGFEFIAPNGGRDELASSGRYVWLTFDDGYRNNLRVLPLLERYKVPATFYIASGFVKSGHGFWWDIVHRELKARGATTETVQDAQNKLKSKKSKEIQSALIERFGSDCLEPTHDVGRPLTPEDLKSLAKNPWVAIGNHTRDHEVLANCSVEEASFQIGACQEDLTQMFGKVPTVFAYPSGSTRQGTEQVLQDLGLQLALTTTPGKNSVKALRDAGSRYLLKRYILWGRRDIASQVRSFAGIRPSDVAYTIRRHVFQIRGY